MSQKERGQEKRFDNKISRSMAAEKTVAFKQLVCSPIKPSAEKVQVLYRTTNNSNASNAENLTKSDENKHARISEVFPMSDEMKTAVTSLGNLDVLPEPDKKTPANDNLNMNITSSCPKRNNKLCNMRPTRTDPSCGRRLKVNAMTAMNPIIPLVVDKISSRVTSAVEDDPHQSLEELCNFSEPSNRRRTVSDVSIRTTEVTKNLRRAYTMPHAYSHSISDVRKSSERYSEFSDKKTLKMNRRSPRTKKLLQATSAESRKGDVNEKREKFFKTQGFRRNEDVKSTGDLASATFSQSNAAFRRKQFAKSSSHPLNGTQSADLISRHEVDEISLKCEKWLVWRSCSDESNEASCITVDKTDS